MKANNKGGTALCLPPFYDENSSLLILGAFPSVRSREAGFYFMHPQNRFWRVLSLVYGEELPQDTEGKKLLLKRRGIALFDVIASCEIKGSSDASIKNAVANDIGSILRKTRISRVFAAGRTAHRLYGIHCEAGAGLQAGYLPSTSPANCAMSLEKLAEIWGTALINS